MITRIGRDAFGEMARKTWEQDDVATSHVLVDDISAHMESRPTVPMAPLADDDLATKEGFFEYSYEHRALPSEVVVTDYDYLRPSTAIEAEALRARSPTVEFRAELVRSTEASALLTRVAPAVRVTAGLEEE